MTRAWVEARGLDVDTLEGRPLLRGLSVALADEQVAVVGRNGVGKSTLLALLSGETPHPRVVRRGRSLWVRQELGDEAAALRRAAALVERQGDGPWRRAAAEAGLRPLDELRAGALSPGERRKLALITALLEEPDLLLLDEPGEDLDEAGLAWLEARLRRWRRGLVVVSHDRRLLNCFQHFFVMAESGCRHVPGSFTAVEDQLGLEQAGRQVRYLEQLSRLSAEEADDLRVRRRRLRKKALGRLHELKRCTPRSRLNLKRSGAQVSQARVAAIRDARIGAVRSWARAARRSLAVELPLRLTPPALPPDDGRPLVLLEGVGLSRGGRALFDGVDLRLGRERVAVLGPNGAGKTSLLQVMLGRLTPDRGAAWARRDRIGVIDQGTAEWRSDDTLLARLAAVCPGSPAELAELLIAHRFPLPLAERPLRSLSPGERARAALICLFQRRPAVELIVLDEPTCSLDRVGAAALAEALRAWPGGLVLASHDRGLVEAVGVERRVVLGA
jgi:ATPase subunit of ABC transporter with duplicated ATPase domains